MKFACNVRRIFAAGILLALAMPGALRAAEKTIERKLPNIVVVTAEQEYHAKETLPAFFKAEIEPRFGWKAKFINSDSTTDIPGLDALDDADLLVMFIRRRTLPEEQLAKFRKYLDRGKPLVALRTSSHAFQNWPTFDQDVLGCKYTNHYANELATSVRIAPGASINPIVDHVQAFESRGSLYKSAPLAKTVTPLLVGKAGDHPEEPVAWTNVSGKSQVFYTSLGHPDDFKTPAFRQFLVNGIAWALEDSDASIRNLK